MIWVSRYSTNRKILRGINKLRINYSRVVSSMEQNEQFSTLKKTNSHQTHCIQFFFKKILIKIVKWILIYLTKRKNINTTNRKWKDYSNNLSLFKWNEHSWTSENIKIKTCWVFTKLTVVRLFFGVFLIRDQEINI